MRPSDVAELCTLAALWGGAFLFMRMGAGEFGPIALAGIRVIGASLLLLPLLVVRRQAGDLVKNWRRIFFVGVANSALPFLCFSYAALSISAGLSSIFNAATPLFSAALAWLWLKERLDAQRVVGLAMGFAGVAWLAWDKVGFKAGGAGLAVLACIVATFLYAFSGVFTKRYLSGVAPLAVAAGSQLGGTLFLAVPTALAWPAVPPSTTAWVTAVLLALFCTGTAYILFFRLIANVGATNAIAVTFLIPAFTALWSWLVIDEGITWKMAASCAVIVAGTALATGFVGARRRSVAEAASTR